MQDKMRFSFATRSAWHVATSVAMEIARLEAEPCSWGEKESSHRVEVPVFLSISGMSTTSPAFSFEGGTVVQVFLHEVGQYAPTWQTPHSQEWVALSARVRSGHGGNKTEELWEAERLLELKKTSVGWNTPDVRKDVGDVVKVVLKDNRHYRVGWDRDNEWYLCHLLHEVGFSHLIPGDKGRACAEAREWLYNHLRENGWSEYSARTTADETK